MKKQNGDIRPRAMLGLILIGLAVLLFLNNIGIRVLAMVFSHWPLILLALGAYLLVGRRGQTCQTRGVLPYVLLGVGGAGLLTRYGFWHFSMGALVGPAILLAVGLYLFRPERHERRHRKERDDETRLRLEVESGTSASDATDEPPERGAEHARRSALDDQKIDQFSILGGSNYVTRSQKLKSGNIVCILGGSELDLRDADTDEDVLTIDVLTFMGGVEVRIPPHWQVTVKALPVLGGVTNKTTCLADKMGVASKQLVITGLAVMGGIDIRN